MTIDELLARLDGAHCNGTGWTAKCPAHNDRHNSLSVKDAGDKLLVNCHAGCRTEDVLAVLGLGFADLYTVQRPSPNGHKPVGPGKPHADPLGWLASYCAVPADFLEKLPLAVADGRIAFTFDGDVRKLRRPGGKDFQWEPAGAPTPALWPLPAETLPPTTWLAEGETDALVARHIGLPAYACTKGAGTALTPDQATALKARGVQTVCILYDADQAGRDGARRQAEVLTGAGIAVKVLDLAAAGLVDPLAGQKDIRDAWLTLRDADKLRERLEAIAATAQLWNKDSSCCSTPTLVVPAESILRFTTAAEIGRTTPAAVEWVAKPWIAAGATTEIDGKIKASGKTTFITHMVRKVLDGGLFMEEPTRKTPVVYLSEQPARSLREALRRADLLNRDDLSILLWHDTVGVKWPEVVKQAIAECNRIGATLLVVDTLGQFAKLTGDAENSAGEALAAMQPLQEAAAAGIAVVIIRHERKAGGDVGDSGRGSSAFAGAVDIVLSIRRPEGAMRPTLRVIHGLSRFDETPATLVVELTPAGYVACGEEADVALQTAIKAVFVAAPKEQEKAATLAQLLEDGLVKLAGVRRNTAQEAVKTLVDSGRLVRLGAGKKGDPFRYWRPPGDAPTDGRKDSAGTTSLKRQNEIESDEVDAEPDGGDDSYQPPDEFWEVDADDGEKDSAGTASPKRQNESERDGSAAPWSCDECGAAVGLEPAPDFGHVSNSAGNRLTLWRAAPTAGKAGK